MAGVSISNLTRREAPRLPFADVAATVLPGWDISLVLATPAKAQQLNKELRKKIYVPNVLSYEVGKKNGEIILCLSVADTQAKDYQLSKSDYYLYLFIHGCLHLKGYPHGTTMEVREKKLLARFAKDVSHTTKTHGTTHRNRH